MPSCPAFAEIDTGARPHLAHVFRVNALAAFVSSARARIDVAVREVGMGGRLTRSICSTRMSRRRAVLVTEWLATPSRRRRRKAGIFRREVPHLGARHVREASSRAPPRRARDCDGSESISITSNGRTDGITSASVRGDANCRCRQFRVRRSSATPRLPSPCWKPRNPRSWFLTRRCAPGCWQSAFRAVSRSSRAIRSGSSTSRTTRMRPKRSPQALPQDPVAAARSRSAAFSGTRTSSRLSRRTGSGQPLDSVGLEGPRALAPAELGAASHEQVQCRTCGGERGLPASIRRAPSAAGDRVLVSVLSDGRTGARRLCTSA